MRQAGEPLRKRSIGFAQTELQGLGDADVDKGQHRLHRAVGGAERGADGAAVDLVEGVEELHQLVGRVALDADGVLGHPGQLGLADVDAALLERLADNQLAAQGFVRTQANPDMLLDMQVFARQSKGGNSSIGIGIGMPVGRHGSVGLGTSQLLNKGKQEGVMLIDVTRASDNTLVWRGSAEGIPLIQFSLSAEQKLGATLAQLLGKFPPSSAP